MLISRKITLSLCLFWQIISFILPPNEYGCVYAWTRNIATDRLTEDADFGKTKIIFSDEAEIMNVNKQNCRIWVAENPHAYIKKPMHQNDSLFLGHFSSKMNKERPLQSMAIVEKPARIHCKADAPKTSHCLVRILVQRHNWAIFCRKWARWGRYSQWRSLSVHVERIFVHKNWGGGYWQHLVSTGGRYVPHSRCYIRCFALCFWRWHYQPQSWCRLAT